MTGDVAVIRVFYADRRGVSEDTIAAWVTAADRDGLSARASPGRRAEYLGARALLRHALEQCTGRRGADHRLRVTAEGKPECMDGPAISVSHSGDFLACAVAPRGAVGVDIETRPPRASLDGIAERYFTPAEARWVGDDPGTRFPLLWVLKEAYLKALGVGLAGGLGSLECRLEPPVIVARSLHAAAPPHLTLLRGAGFYLGVAALGVERPAVSVDAWYPEPRAARASAVELIAQTA